jgi:hypothetical protein
MLEDGWEIVIPHEVGGLKGRNVSTQIYLNSVPYFMAMALI